MDAIRVVSTLEFSLAGLGSRWTQRNHKEHEVVALVIRSVCAAVCGGSLGSMVKG